MNLDKGERLLNSHYCVRLEDLPRGDLARIEDDLTYTIPQMYSPEGVDKIFTTCSVDDGILYMPRHYGLMHFGQPTILDTVNPTNGPIVPFPNWTPRPGQEEAVSSICSQLSVKYGGCLEMLAGGGKTVSSLQIAHRMRVPTLVLVHKEFLMNQWVDRIEQFCGVTPGIIQQDTCQWVDRPISIGMIQSLISDRVYDPAMYKHWGMVIIDEVHHMGAQHFNRAIGKFPAHYRLGLTATVHRKDGTSDVFFRSIGRVLHTAKVQRVQGDAYFILTPITVNDKAYRMRGGPAGKRKVNRAKMITNLSKNVERNEIILHHLENGYNQGRKIIALSHRREHLNYLENEMHKRGCIDTGQYVGQGSSSSEKAQERARLALEKASKAQLIFATYQMASEGLDLPSLDCAHFMTPISDPEQSAGRIQRICEGKPKPIGIYYKDRGSSTLDNTAKNAKRVLSNIGFSIKT